MTQESLHASESEPSSQEPGLTDTLSQLSREAAVLGQEFAKLAADEVGLALYSLPRLLAASLAALFLTATTWLGLSATIAYGAYELTGSGFLGFASFALMQLGGLCLCKVLMAKYSERMTLPLSREFIVKFKRGFHEQNQ